MEKIEIFAEGGTGTNSKCIEEKTRKIKDKVNKWFAENSLKVKIIKRDTNTSVCVNGYMITITIWYQDITKSDKPNVPEPAGPAGRAFIKSS